MKLLLIILIFLLPLSNAVSSNLGWGSKEFTEELQSDRPDFTEGAYVVDPGHLQLESGITYHSYRHGYGVTVPEILLRIGIIEKIEFRFNFDGYDEENQSDKASNYGVTPYSLGGKLNLYQVGSERFSIITEATIPGGSEENYNSRVTYGFKLLYERDIESLSLAGNIDLYDINERNKEEKDQYTELSFSLSLGHEVYGPLSMYIEYYTIDSLYTEKDRQMFINSGFTYLVLDDLQLDVRYGMGLDRSAGSNFSGIGSVIRF